MDAFQNLNDALAGFGHTLEARTRLTFGSQVAKALAGIESGGVVIVTTQGTTDEQVAQYNDLINTNVSKVALVDARTNTYTQVRPNVSSFLKSRKIAHAITPPRKNEDGPIGFLIRKP